ncbi:MAG: ABC transporter substrate-binding protein [Hyphomicrobiales bacterium]
MTKQFKLTAFAAITALSVSFGALAAQADEIRVLNWKGYGTDEDWALKAFTEKTGHTVTHDYFNSEQEMLTKMRTNPGAYDVVLINSAYTKQAKDEGLIEKIDTADMPNVKDLAPNMAGNPDLAPNGETYGVAWVWGLTSFAVNKNDVTPMPDSIQVLWDEKYKGKVGWRDDAVESVYFGAIATGQKISDIKDLDAVKEKLAKLLPQIKTFWSSENDWNQFFAAGDFVMAPYWSGSAGRSMSKGLPVEFVVPKEGAIAWLDGLSIPKGSKHPEAARAFINYMISPDFNVEWAGKGAPAPANSKVAEKLPEDDLNRSVLGDPEVVARVQFMAPLSEDKRKEYLELWQELKATSQ